MTSFMDGFPAWIRHETDIRRQSTILICEKCGEVIHTVTFRDTVEKDMFDVREECENAIYYHVSDECYTDAKIPILFTDGRSTSVRIGRQVTRGRDLPINVFDFEEDCQVWFDKNDRQFNVRCRLCRAHVCTIDESVVEERLVDYELREVTHFYVKTIKREFGKHKNECKMIKRIGLRVIRTDRREK